MAEMNTEIRQIEFEVTRLLHGTDIDTVRRNIRYALQSLAGLPPNNSRSLIETLDDISSSGEPIFKRRVAIMVIRLLSQGNIFNPNSTNQGNHRIVKIVEEGASDIVDSFLNGKKIAQSHQKILLFTQIHEQACGHLEVLLQNFSSLPDLNGKRQAIMRSLNNGLIKKYLQIFEYNSFLTSITGLLSQVADVVQASGITLQDSLIDLLSTIDDEIENFSNTPYFVFQNYYLPFITKLKSVAVVLKDTLAERFACEIVVPPSSLDLEKKYPLHLIGTKLQVFIPLTNLGPGIAQNVQAYCISEDCTVVSEETRLGNITPGDFILPISFEPTKVSIKVILDIEIRWSVIGDVKLLSRDFTVCVEAQNTNIDWEELLHNQPYRLEVAYGKDFYGRGDAVKRILRHMDQHLMQSCYITGQKRVGKSSLAHAVEYQLNKAALGDIYQVLYLECGEIIHIRGEDTFMELGERIQEFLLQSMPRSEKWDIQKYTSSLAPLNRLLDRLNVVQPQKRFVIILDEFDEINESLYRHGDLASTFFLNLRTLSSRSNLCFLLVGAERMPYVMASQGDKLNRFDRELLNSFDQENEWGDYQDFIRLPVKNSIEWHNSALYTLYDLTNGQPYFTKLLCAKVYDIAVGNKDAEICRTEVENAASQIVNTLDSNAFAHYWRDGIRGDANDVEIISLKRCRLLLAWVRSARSKNNTSLVSIQNNVHSVNLNSVEILPLLEDFCRRGIFREKDGEYMPVVELFAYWLKEAGFSLLIADKLGDELAEAKQREEDLAYVKAEEIVELTRKWDLYQGREITSENVRAWLNQVETNIERRRLFKLLQRLRFYKDAEVRERLKSAHASIRKKLPIIVKTNRAQRRDDIVVTYADGPGKSGAYYAALYANSNDIISDNVVAPSDLAKFIHTIKPENTPLRGIVLVDDIIGTGFGIIDNLKKMFAIFEDLGIGNDLPLLVVVLCSVKEGEKRVRKFLGDNFPNGDLEICETLSDEHYVFMGTNNIWENKGEEAEVKALLINLGSLVQKRNPLGFGDQGLLLTFSRNCPNNSLPILHGSGKVTNPWIPLFPRMKT